MLTKIKGYLAIAASLGGVWLYAWVQTLKARRARESAAKEKARADTAEARIVQRARADEASEQAKVKGDEKVKQAVAAARSGDRNHFSK